MSYDLCARNVMTGAVRVLAQELPLPEANSRAEKAIMRRSSAHEIVFIAPSGAFSKTSTIIRP
mgnify:CR=1 FL=1